MPTWRELQGSRTFAVATVLLLAVAITITLLQIAVPEIRLQLWRDRGALQSGQFWRLATPLSIQYDPWPSAATVLLLVAFIGTAVERVYGAPRLLAIQVSRTCTGPLSWSEARSERFCRSARRLRPAGRPQASPAILEP